MLWPAKLVSLTRMENRCFHSRFFSLEAPEKEKKKNSNEIKDKLAIKDNKRWLKKLKIEWSQLIRQAKTIIIIFLKKKEK